MKIVSATDCKTRLGQYLELAHSEPVAIQKNERSVAVLLSYSEYERLLAMENSYWLEQAKKAEKSGYVGSTKAMKLLQAGLSAET